MALAFTAVAVSFAQDTTKKEDTGKKKSKKKKKGPALVSDNTTAA